MFLWVLWCIVHFPPRNFALFVVLDTDISLCIFGWNPLKNKKANWTKQYLSNHLFLFSSDSYIVRQQKIIGPKSNWKRWNDDALSDDTKFQQYLKSNGTQHLQSVGREEVKPISLYTFLNYDFSTIWSFLIPFWGC